MIINIQILLNGDDITDYVLEYERNQDICTGVGTLDFSVAKNIPYSFDPWDTIVLYEDDIKKGTYNLSTFDYGLTTGVYSLSCQDDSKRLMDYFIADSYEITENTHAREWLVKFLDEAGVTYDISGIGNGSPLSNNTQLGLNNAYDTITTLLQTSGWYMYFNADGVCIIGSLYRNTGTFVEELTDDHLLTIQRVTNDSMLRNRAVVWGVSNQDGDWVFADLSTTTPWNYDSNDLRAVVLTNSGIPNTQTAESLAQQMLDEFATISNERTLQTDGAKNINIGNNVFVTYSDMSGLGLVTHLSSYLSKDGGLVTTMTLDQKCPRLFAYFGNPDDPGPPIPSGLNYVYAGVIAGDVDSGGVYRKDLALPYWEDYSDGLTSDGLPSNVTDLFVKGGIFVCVKTDGIAYVRTLANSSWIQVAHGTFTDRDEVEYEEEDIMAIACTIGRSNSNIYVLYTTRDLETIVEPRTWLARVGTGGQIGLKEQVFIYNKNTPGLNKEEIQNWEGIDLDRNSKTNLISTRGPITVLFGMNDRDLYPFYYPWSGSIHVSIPVSQATSTGYVLPDVPNIAVSGISDVEISLPYRGGAIKSNLVKKGNLWYDVGIRGGTSIENVLYMEYLDIHTLPYQAKKYNFGVPLSGTAENGETASGYYTCDSLYLDPIPSGYGIKSYLSLDLGDYCHLHQRDDGVTFDIIVMDKIEASPYDWDLRHHKLVFQDESLVCPVAIETVYSGIITDKLTEMPTNSYEVTPPLFNEGRMLFAYYGRKPETELYDEEVDITGFSPTSLNLYYVHYVAETQTLTKERVINHTSLDESAWRQVEFTYIPKWIPYNNGATLAIIRKGGEDWLAADGLRGAGRVSVNLDLLNFTYAEGFVPKVDESGAEYYDSETLAYCTDKLFQECGDDYQTVTVSKPASNYSIRKAYVEWTSTSLDGNVATIRAAADLYSDYANVRCAQWSKYWDQRTISVRVPDNVIIADNVGENFANRVWEGHWVKFGPNPWEWRCECTAGELDQRDLFEWFVYQPGSVHPVVATSASGLGCFIAPDPPPAGYINITDKPLESSPVIPDEWKGNGYPSGWAIFDATTLEKLYSIPLLSGGNFGLIFSLTADSFDRTLPVSTKYAKVAYFVDLDSGDITKTMSDFGRSDGDLLFIDGYMIVHHYAGNLPALKLIKFPDELFDEYKACVIFTHQDLHPFTIIDVEAVNTVLVDVSKEGPGLTYTSGGHLKIWNQAFTLFNYIPLGPACARSFNYIPSGSTSPNRYVGMTHGSGLYVVQMYDTNPSLAAVFSGDTDAFETSNNILNQYMFVGLFSIPPHVYQKNYNEDTFIDYPTGLPTNGLITIVRLDEEL